MINYLQKRSSIMNSWHPKNCSKHSKELNECLLFLKMLKSTRTRALGTRTRL